MQQTLVTIPEFKLLGLTCRTNNAQLFECDPTTNKVAAIVQKYFHNNFATKIPNRKNPGTTYCVYTQYASDFNGDYTYFIGEAVNEFTETPAEFEQLIIPAQQYMKFTNGPGPMPQVCIDLWKTIWTKTTADLQGERSYIADFEIYDERSSDHQAVTLDICIGIKK